MHAISNAFITAFPSQLHASTMLIGSAAMLSGLWYGFQKLCCAAYIERCQEMDAEAWDLK